MLTGPGKPPPAGFSCTPFTYGLDAGSPPAEGPQRRPCLSPSASRRVSSRRWLALTNPLTSPTRSPEAA
jgi:hypothetical protein